MNESFSTPSVTDKSLTAAGEVFATAAFGVTDSLPLTEFTALIVKVYYVFAARVLTTVVTPLKPVT